MASRKQEKCRRQDTQEELEDKQVPGPEDIPQSDQFEWLWRSDVEGSSSTIQTSEHRAYE